MAAPGRETAPALLRALAFGSAFAEGAHNAFFCIYSEKMIKFVLWLDIIFQL